MIFSIVLTIIILTLIISFTGSWELSQWIAIGLLYVLHFNNKSAQIDKLSEEIAKLKKQIGCKDGMVIQPQTSPAPATTEKKAEKPADITAKPVAAVNPAAMPVTRREQPVKMPYQESSASFFGQNLIVWIAGFAAILGAFYLIRYSVEHGILGPRVRFALMTLFGMVLTFAGYGIYGSNDLANHKRIGQSLMGVGLSTLYFAAYAVSEIYHFTSQGMSFVWMLAVTGMAVILTLLRGGKPIALLTMLGAFLTPALAGAEQASPCFFSLYMLIFAGVFALMAVEMASILLLGLAIGGLYLWGLYWLFFGNDSLVSLWQMILLAGITVIFLRASARLSQTQNIKLQIPAVLGCFFFGFGYVIRMQFGIMEWAIIGLMTVALAILSFKDIKNYLPLLAGSVIAGLVIWMFPAQPKNLPVFAGYAAAALLPVYCSLWIRGKAAFAGYIGIFALMFYAVYCYIFRLDNIQTFVGLITAVLLLLPMFRFKLDTEEMQQAAGITILTAAIITAIAFSKLLTTDILPIIAASGVLLFAALGKLCRAKYMLTGWILSFAWFVYLQFKPISYLALFLFIGPVWSMPISINAVSGANILTYGLIPLLCFGSALFMMPARSEPRRVMFFSSAILLSGCIFAFFVRSMASFSYTPDFMVNAVITDLLIASYGFVVKSKSGSPVLSGIGFWRLGIICLALLLLGLPGRGINVGEAIAGFAVPLGIFIWLASIARSEKSFLSKCALVCSFYFMTLMVTIPLQNGKTFFLFAKRASSIDIFSYSVAWMLLGICWLISAKWIKAMAKPAFVLIYFVIAKVFLYDVAGMSDFARILALFALAASLFVIGFFHAVFFKEEK